MNKIDPEVIDALIIIEQDRDLGIYQLMGTRALKYLIQENKNMIEKSKEFEDCERLLKWRKMLIKKIHSIRIVLKSRNE